MPTPLSLALCTLTSIATHGFIHQAVSGKLAPAAHRRGDKDYTTLGHKGGKVLGDHLFLIP
ncbi:MAG: hypothetical protein ACI81P_001278 [Neolewinella sp.]|jgi:hypothetical protein